ncbi:hypothetical protein I6E61_09360 [Psychrobacter sp. NZS113]|uniref:hypothetical protein n=1 Tax=Psychrobacter sp. NZS113 TaxID=2792045 RepID=UPI0018CE25AB|nr:hypothetical protein [Psychrobacter sp. NZS113]MBH0096590.1 hypothetical protein [Psychrobacter sp. NZS113]
MTKITSPIFNDVMLVYMENWQLKYQDEYLDLDVGIFEVLMSLFPFLEQKKSFYIGMIDSNDIEAINSFPVKEIIEEGFLHDIPYWVKLAVEWLDNENNDDLNVYFSTYLNKIVNNKVYEQRTRQIAEKILNYNLQNLDK